MYAADPVERSAIQDESTPQKKGSRVGKTTTWSDAGLVHLKGLNELKRLLLVGTRVTNAGVNDLKEALPNCTISRL